MEKYAEIIKDVKATDDVLLKNGEVLAKIGDVCIDTINTYRKYELISMDLHFMTFKKIEVGDFEKNQLNKNQVFQTVHFLDNDLNLKNYKWLGYK